jgi:hypothetical protein
LEGDGIVTRKDCQVIPPRVEYSLAGFGVSLGEALRLLCDWGREHIERIARSKASREPGGRAAAQAGSVPGTPCDGVVPGSGAKGDRLVESTPTL